MVASSKQGPSQPYAESSARGWAAATPGGSLEPVRRLVEQADALYLRAPELMLVFGERAAALAEAAGSDELWIRAESQVVSAKVRLGERAATVGRAVAALHAAEHAGYSAIAARLRIDLAVCARSVGAPLTGLVALRPVLADQNLTAAHRAAALSHLVGCLAQFGRKAELDRVLLEADRLCAADETLDADTRWLLRGMVRVGISAHRRRHGDLTAAADAARTGLGYLERLHRPDDDGGLVRIRLTLQLVCTLLDRGDVEMALEVAQPLLTAPMRAAAVAPSGWLKLAIATRVLLPSGSSEAATTLMREAVYSTDRHGLHTLTARLWLELAQVEERLGRPGEAIDCLHRSRAAEHLYVRARRQACALLSGQFGAGVQAPVELEELLSPAFREQQETGYTYEPARTRARETESPREAEPTYGQAAESGYSRAAEPVYTREPESRWTRETEPRHEPEWSRHAEPSRSRDAEQLASERPRNGEAVREAGWTRDADAKREPERSRDGEAAREPGWSRDAEPQHGRVRDSEPVREPERARNGEALREPGWSRDVEPQRESGRMRDAEPTRDFERPRDAEASREAGWSRDAEAQREPERSRDGERTREAGWARDAEPQRETERPRDVEVPREGAWTRDAEPQRESERAREFATVTQPERLESDGRYARDAEPVSREAERNQEQRYAREPERASTREPEVRAGRETESREQDYPRREAEQRWVPEREAERWLQESRREQESEQSWRQEEPSSTREPSRGGEPGMRRESEPEWTRASVAEPRAPRDSEDREQESKRLPEAREPERRERPSSEAKPPWARDTEPKKARVPEWEPESRFASEYGNGREAETKLAPEPARETDERSWAPGPISIRPPQLPEIPDLPDIPLAPAPAAEPAPRVSRESEHRVPEPSAPRWESTEGSRDKPSVPVARTTRHDSEHGSVAAKSVLDRLGITSSAGGRRRAPSDEPPRGESERPRYESAPEPKREPKPEPAAESSYSEEVTGPWLPRLKMPPALDPFDADSWTPSSEPFGDNSYAKAIAADEPPADAGLADLLARALAEHQAGTASAAALVKQLGSRHDGPPRPVNGHRANGEAYEGGRRRTGE